MIDSSPFSDVMTMAAASRTFVHGSWTLDNVGTARDGNAVAQVAEGSRLLR